MKNDTVMAVTGEPGAGKSTVSRLFEELGGFLIDADRIVAGLWRSPEIIDAAFQRWGKDVMDEEGHIRHASVAKIIFSDRGEYAWVTALLHPLVRKEIQSRIAQPDRKKTWTIVEIPLLFESGAPSWVTVKVFVTASRAVRLERCRSRGWSDADLAERESFFMDSEKRMALSDFVIRNEGSLEALKTLVEEVCAKCT
ncbi:MAG: dephospho-CoA kinase [Synergistaceae bacterium]|nr:dephospho-CoA kinase [Synergistaceae bacterium]